MKIYQSTKLKKTQKFDKRIVEKSYNPAGEFKNEAYKFTSQIQIF